MTLDEAIYHCKAKTEQSEPCNESCAADHSQLAEWLQELKTLRENTPKTGFAGFLEMFQREDGYISMVRVMAAIAFVIFFALYIIAFFKAGCVFQFFETFATVVTTIIFSTLGSKFLDFRQQINLGRR